MTTTLQQHGKQCGVIIKKTCFYLPVRRHDFGSLVEGDTLWAGVAFCLQMRWSMDFVSPCYFFGFCDMMIGPGRDFKLKDISIVMSLSLHCQNCKKCRRRVVVTLPPHCHHIAATSPPHRRHIAATSPPHRRHIAATLPPHRRHLAAALPPHRRHSCHRTLFLPIRSCLAKTRPYWQK